MSLYTLILIYLSSLWAIPVPLTITGVFSHRGLLLSQTIGYILVLHTTPRKKDVIEIGTN